MSALTALAMNNSPKVVQAAGKKLVTPWLGVEIGTSNIDPAGERPHTGLGNLEIGPKYQFLKNAEHEVIMSIGFEAEIGGTGTPHSVANSFSTWTPTLVASSIGGEALTLGLITTVFTKTHFWQSLSLHLALILLLCGLLGFLLRQKMCLFPHGSFRVRRSFRCFFRTRGCCGPSGNECCGGCNALARRLHFGRGSPGPLLKLLR